MDQQALHRLVVLLDEALTACPSEEMGKAMQVFVDRGRPNTFKQRIFVRSTILIGDITYWSVSSDHRKKPRELRFDLPIGSLGSRVLGKVSSRNVGEAF